MNEKLSIRDNEDYKTFSCFISVKYLGKDPDKLQLLNILQHTFHSCKLILHCKYPDMRASTERITHKEVMFCIDSRFGNSEPSPSKLLILLENINRK
jgi:hypothetical protein